MATLVDVYVLLDVLLIILIALFIPIGFWRGVYREAFVTLGILFGATLGSYWGERWGIELAQVTRLHESGGAFMIAMLCLISATFLLGYSAGAALPVPDPGWVARTLGALVAAANGALLLSFALQDIRLYLLTSEEVGFLDNAVVAPFLSDGTGWILLVAAAVFVPISLVLALFGPDIEDDEYYETDEYGAYDEPEYDSYPQRTLQHGPQMQRPVVVGPVPPAYSPPAPAEETRPVPAMQQSAPDDAADAIQQPAPQSHTPPASAFGAQQVPQARAEMTEPHPPPQSRTADVNAEAEQASDVAAPQFGAVAMHSEQPAGPDVPVSLTMQAEEPEPEAAEEPPRERTDEYPAHAPSAPEPRTPQFGTRTVEESTNERRIVFGHRPASVEQAPIAARRQSGKNCPNCQADIRDASGFCPRCGVPI